MLRVAYCAKTMIKIATTQVTTIELVTSKSPP